MPLPNRQVQFVAALLAIACGSVGVRAQVFVNSTAATGVNVPPYAASNGHGRGHAWDDFDGDGDMDLFAPGGIGQPILLWINQGGGVFLSQAVVQIPSPFSTHGCISGDIDNDGDKDVFLCTGDWVPNRLYVNQGNATFVEQAVLRGVAHAGDSYCASFGDFDRDGWIDLYIGDLFAVPGTSATFAAHHLYRNLGAGFFADVTAAAGAAAPSAALTVLWHDYDEDGWPDLHLGNDRGNFGAPPNALLKNLRNGAFSDVAPTVNANAPIGCMGITVGDIKNDGDWDVFLTNVQTGHVVLPWSDTNAAYLVGASWFFFAGIYGFQTNQIGWSTQFLDYDHDGRLDLFVMHTPGPNRLFRGTNLVAFADDTFVRAIDQVLPGSHSSATVDYDDDGDLDLYLPGDLVAAQFAQNPMAGTPGTHWLRVHLEGTISNRDAFGAVVRVVDAATGIVRRRMKTSGEGYLSDGDKRLHFGLGAAALVDVEVRWPSGGVSHLSNVATDQQVDIVEPCFVSTGTFAPGTINLLNFSLPDDVGLTWIAALAVDVFNETPVGAGRFLRINVADPLVNFTTTPGNGVLLPHVGGMSAAGAATVVVVPSLPWLSGAFFAIAVVTVDPLYPSSVKSIIGPHGVFIP